MARRADTIVDLPSITDIEGAALETAWQHGAWDVTRTALPAGLRGALEPMAMRIEAIAREQGYVVWAWRPMLMAPEIRTKAWASKDTTLDSWSLGRTGAAPPVLRAAIIPGRQAIIRLGEAPAIAPPVPITLPARGWLEVEATSATIRLPWHRDIVPMLRQIKGRRYRPSDHAWIIPARSYRQLAAVIAAIDSIIGEP